MLSIEEIKGRVDCRDLAHRLGLEAPHGDRGNYRAPHRADRQPSLSIFDDGRAWKDHAEDRGGDAIELVRYVDGCDVKAAIKRLHELYGWEYVAKHRPPTRPKGKPPLAEYIAGRCRQNPDGVVEYLAGRGIPESTTQHAIKCGAVGFNEWTNDKKKPGEFGFGGPAAAGIVRDLITDQVRAVDLRYIDPELNGGYKAMSQGEKRGFPWFLDRRRLERAKTVYVVESWINALSIAACNIPHSAEFAVRGVASIEHIPWENFRGKLLVVAMDADPPKEDGIRPGDRAAWAIYERAAAVGVAARLVNQHSWREDDLNDVNDVLQARGPDGLFAALRELDNWLIPGLPGRDLPPGKQRVYIPGGDFADYWRYRVRDAHTSFVTKIEKNNDGVDMPEFEDLAGFRIATVERVRIAGAESVLSGGRDLQPTTLFSVSVQTPRHGPELIRRVFTDERLHNMDQWRKFGPVFNSLKFARAVNLMEWSAHTNARDAINLVGVGYRAGKPVVNEGPDCYFSDPDKQCPYHSMVFPSGSIADAKRVVHAMRAMFTHDASLQVLVWTLGGHLKAFLGFWPHLVLQARKGAGKSTLLQGLGRLTGMTTFGGQSLGTEFRILTSISHTVHPIAWEELSSRGMVIIEKAVSMLQEAYTATVTRRNADMVPYLICAPVLLAGEDVPVKSLIGKLVRVDLSGRKNELLPDNLPPFPLKEWCQFLARQRREEVKDIQTKWRSYLKQSCSAIDNDDGAARMIGNYAALLTAWTMLQRFAEVPDDGETMARLVVAEMNRHIMETRAEREPWVWVLETFLNELDSGMFKLHAVVDDYKGKRCLLVRPSSIYHHISSNANLRSFYDALPIKSHRIFKKQMDDAGVVVSDRVEKAFKGVRIGGLCALDIDRLREFGLDVTDPGVESAPPRDFHDVN